MERRSFLKALGAMGGASLLGSSLRAGTAVAGTEMMGILVDTTRCAGCRACEEICGEVNSLPEIDYDDAVLDKHRTTSITQYSVINRYETEKGEVFVKTQCMNCVQPACASACLTKAMKKTEEGPVTWDEKKCMGCRFCMVSCPFDMPKFEYNSPVPRIQKCNMCWDRLQEGELPACVENCPNEALMFGTRRELLDEAKRRIYQNPNDYVHHIYGEHEVGGTGYMYLSAVPFDQIGFRTDVGNEALPEMTRGFLYNVPVIETMLPLLLLGVHNATKRNADKESEA